MARYAEELGADGLLAALHVFYHLDERDIYEHYETLCAATSLPVLYYNFPANSGLRLSPRSIARIAEIDGIVGRQDDHLRGGPDGGTGPSGRRGLLLLLRAPLSTWSKPWPPGLAELLPIPNFAPDLVVEMYEAMASGDRERADALQARVSAYAPLMAYPAPHAVEKEALRLLGHPVGTVVKPPLPQLTPEQAEQVRSILATL